MTRDEIQSTILANILLDTELYQSDQFRYLANGHWKNRRGHLLSQKASDAAQGIVPYKPSEWLGRPLTGSERVQFCKVLRGMAVDGLVVCYVDSRGRTTHVVLTPEGEQAAPRLVIAEEESFLGGSTIDE